MNAGRRSAAIGVSLTAIIVTAFIASAPALAQTSRPASTSTSALETQAFPQTRAVSTARGDNAINWKNLVFALAIVLGLIVALRYLAGFLMPHTRANGTGRGVRVLSRTVVAPRQQVLLLHVGRRVLVVGDSAGTLAPLANIDEPDEVAELLGQVASLSPATATSKFRAMFGRAENDYDGANPEHITAADDPDAVEPTDPAVAAAKQDLDGLLDRMRSLTKTVGK